MFNSSGGDNSTPTNFSDGFLPIDKRARRGLFQPPAAPPGAAAAPPTSPNLQRHESALSTTRSSSGASSDNLNLSDYISRRVEEEIEAMDGDNLLETTAVRTGDLTIPAVTPRGSLETGPRSKNRLRAVAELPEEYRKVFAKFPYFNHIQSAVFDDVFHTDRPMVVAAPTGCGKTVIFELAIIRVLQMSSDLGGVEIQIPLRPKMVYMAPMKSLCSEKFREWREKFETSLRGAVRVLELTGDSASADVADIRAYNLILTTPEKWDALTRRWKDHTGLVRMIKLVMIDEVHTINDSSRGHTLEAVVTRMKTISKMIKRGVVNPNGGGDDGAQDSGDTETDAIRFMAVSATAPNAEDVVEWLASPNKGSNGGVHYKFGEEKRPVQLRKVVMGYPTRTGRSDFKFEFNLTYKLADLIKSYSEGKPTLIFATSRRSTQFSAQVLVQAQVHFQFGWTQKQRLHDSVTEISDSKLRECVVKGAINI